MGVFECSEGVPQSANIVLQKRGDPVPHCDSGVLEAGMPIHSVALYSYGQAACEQ